MNAVLSNPLFAVKPARRGSELAAADVLKDPMKWFLNQIATGNATLTKAASCLEMLDRRTSEQNIKLYGGKTAGAVIGDWLRSSNLDTSKEFVDMCVAKPHTRHSVNTFFSRLVSLLVSSGKDPLLWRWFTCSWEPALNPSQVSMFRKQLLEHMVSVEATQDLYRGIARFTQAHERVQEHADKNYGVLRPAGQYLVHAIMSRPRSTVNGDVYNSFLRSTRFWINGKWAQAVDGMLHLHHPTTASAVPGLRFIQDSAGAATFAHAIPGQRRFTVQLCLGVARHLLEEESYQDAQFVMAFAKQHFPDLVLSNLPPSEWQSVDRQLKKIKRERKWEEKNLELLDGLVLT
jgi:hypothetical protein